MMRFAFAFLLIAACGPTKRPFRLDFAAVANGTAATCATTLTGFGPDAQHTVGVSDLRFYISHVQFFDRAGKLVTATFDNDVLQYVDGTNTVALIDLTGNDDGTCAPSALGGGEGTARLHTALTGTTIVDDVQRVTFDIGIPQTVVKRVISDNTLEGAPSPFGEMYWSWASGYRYFVFNFVARDAAGAGGEGYVHVGSRDCGPDGGKALSDRDRCTFVNAPTVSLDGVNLAKNKIVVNLDVLLAGVDFRAPVYDPTTFEVVGETMGVQCHSGPMQPHCINVFSALGLNMADGTADAGANKVFTVQ